MCDTDNLMTFRRLCRCPLTSNYVLVRRRAESDVGSCGG